MEKVVKDKNFLVGSMITYGGPLNTYCSKYIEEVLRTGLTDRYFYYIYFLYIYPIYIIINTSYILFTLIYYF
jgi:hypothetical protein